METIQHTGDNFNEVKEFCKPNKVYGTKYLHVQTYFGDDLTVFVGDSIERNSDGTLSIHKPVLN